MYRYKRKQFVLAQTPASHPGVHKVCLGALHKPKVLAQYVLTASARALVGKNVFAGKRW